MGHLISLGKQDSVFSQVYKMSKTNLSESDVSILHHTVNCIKQNRATNYLILAMSDVILLSCLQIMSTFLDCEFHIVLSFDVFSP